MNAVRLIVGRRGNKFKPGSGSTQSGKRYRVECEPNNFDETDYSPLLGGFESEEEGSNPAILPLPY